MTSRRYRCTRNPMNVGIVVPLLGEAWIAAWAAMLVYAALIALLFHLRVVSYEEPALRRMYGAEFDGYAGRVRRWGGRVNSM